MNRPIRRELPELYMQVIDPKRIKKLMVIQDVTQRQLAEAAWGPKASHSYLGRILRGEIKSIQDNPAIRIAAYLGVGVDDLFVAKVSTQTARNKQRRSAA